MPSISLICAKPSRLLVLLALVATAASGLADDNRKACSVEDEKKKLANAPLGLVAALGAPVKSGQCASVKAVLTRLAGKTVSGGRKLEDDRPLDVAAAEAEWKKARDDAEYQKALTVELDGETDPTRRTLLEAALLHDFGHYKARDLLLMRLSSGTSK